MADLNLTNSSFFEVLDTVAISGKGNRKINFTLLPSGSFYPSSVSVMARFTSIGNLNYPLNTWVQLMPNVDYSFGAKHESASVAAMTAIYAAIIVNDPNAIGVLQITCNSFGADYILPTTTFAAINANTHINPLYLSYEDLAGIAPVNTQRSMADFSQHLYNLVSKVSSLSTNISTYKRSNSYVHYRHTLQHSNMHRVTAKQLNLDKVPNWTVANIADAIAGTAKNMFVTPNVALGLLASLKTQYPIRYLNDGTTLDNVKMLTPNSAYALITGGNSSLQNAFKYAYKKVQVSRNKLIYPLRFNGILCYNFRDIVAVIKTATGLNYLQFNESTNSIYVTSDISLPSFVFG